jgi:hypothetical protein
MKPLTDERAVADIVLERYRLDELPAADAGRLERRLREDGALRDRLRALERSDAELRAGGLAARLADAARRVARAPRRPSRVAWAPARLWFAAATVLALVLVVSLPNLLPRLAAPPVGSPAPGAGDGSLKGLEPSLILFRRGADGSESLADGSRARPGDLIRVAYQAAGRPFGVILSVDGRGAVTLHLPASGATATHLQAGDRVLLDKAYELDDAPRWETFYFVTGDRPFDVEPVLEAARQAAAAAGDHGPPPLHLPPGLDQASFSLVKDGRS